MTSPSGDHRSWIKQVISEEYSDRESKLSKVSELLVLKEESHCIYTTTNLMNLYKDPSEDVISNHGIDKLVCADESKLYLNFNSVDKSRYIRKMESCISDIKTGLP